MMKNFYIRRSTVTNLASALLFVLALLASHIPAAATTYTYTGNLFDYEMPGSVWPATPAIGNTIQFSFTYDGDLSTALNTNLAGTPALLDWTMTCGDVCVVGASTSAVTHAFYIQSLAAGVPSEWYIRLYSGTESDARYMLQTYYVSGVPSDVAWFNSGTGVILAVGSNTSKAGDWTAVPLPSSAFLLGAGLIPLAWARRKRRLGK